MKRRVAVMVLGVVLAVVLAAPAAAHKGLRDPFDPVVDVDAQTGAPADPTDTSTVVETSPDEPTVTDGLPTTGSDPSSWLSIAYVMIACGLGLVVIARLRNASDRERFDWAHSVPGRRRF